MAAPIHRSARKENSTPFIILHGNGVLGAYRAAKRVLGSGFGTRESRRWTSIDTFHTFACYR